MYVQHFTAFKKIIFQIFLQNIGVFIGFSWFGSVAMYAGMILPNKKYEFNSNVVRVSVTAVTANSIKSNNNKR